MSSLGTAPSSVRNVSNYKRKYKTFLVFKVKLSQKYSMVRPD